MTTILVEVKEAQEEMLKELLKGMDITYQEIDRNTDFWDQLSPSVQQGIDKGLSDLELGKVTPFKKDTRIDPETIYF
jgi:hypothetical protein